MDTRQLAYFLAVVDRGELAARATTDGALAELWTATASPTSRGPSADRPSFRRARAARTWEESITARDQSSCFADRSFLSSTACSWSHTPASFQAARRRQQVMPEPKPSSWGRYSHWIPVCSTNRIPHRACRSGTRGRPATSFGPGLGSNGSMSDHSSSDTIHGRD
jgi:hypothetical protein